MTRRRPHKGSHDADALGRGRRFYKWARGEIRKIKRAWSKRARRDDRRETGIINDA